MSDPFVSWFSPDNPPFRIGHRVVHLEQTTSTNSVAAEYVGNSAHDGLVILADAQTAGRGRLGRTWTSPAGEGIWVSVLLFPPEPLRRSSLLTILAAVSVCETIHDQVRLQSSIKWPNDVYIQGKKVCGVLVEQHWGGSEDQPSAIVGIGLNVSTSAERFAAAGLHQAGSLAMFAEHVPSRRAIFQGLLRRLDNGYQELLTGHWADLESRWRWHSGLLGRHVRLISHGETLEGRLLELSFEGIVIQDDQGNCRCFVPETVTELLPIRRR
ncbi:MAG: biotin--[acetyl-CoA-carboxylase] ligase [Gemmatales bacterium]|nr:biotin--[acetyl-CoA-carboxylase] ligase [Gemmatales bacterium]MDW8386475.1 biotin--[acetyl-CoA-carboxylase] ligase [Gemmatales bacterium]